MGFNGVPTLGTFLVSGQTHLFWRAGGYVGDISLWLYVLLSSAEVDRVESGVGPDILSGIVFAAPQDRFASVGIAHLNRIIFGRECDIPANLSGLKVVAHVANFAAEALRVAVDEGVPRTGLEMIKRAQDAINHLVSC